MVRVAVTLPVLDLRPTLPSHTRRREPCRRGGQDPEALGGPPPPGPSCWKVWGPPFGVDAPVRSELGSG